MSENNGEKTDEYLREADGTFAEGNRGGPGRPKMGMTLADMFRDAFSEPIDPEHPEYTKLHAAIDKAITLALEGDFRFLDYAIARGWGKLLDRVFIETPNRKVDLSKLTDEQYEQYKELIKTLQAQDVSQDDVS